MNQFTLSFSPYGPKVSHNQVVTFVSHNRDILSWYAPFSGTLIFKSYLPLAPLTSALRGIFDGEAFVLSQTFPNLTGGAQGSFVWNWINTGAIPALPAPQN